MSVNRRDLTWTHGARTNAQVNGTSLAFKNRGWLSASHLEANGPDEMRCLLTGVVNLLDLPRCTFLDYRKVQEVLERMKKIIASISMLLTQTYGFEIPPAGTSTNKLPRHCNMTVRELSSLDRIVERFNWAQKVDLGTAEFYVEWIVDELLLKVYRVVIESAFLVEKLDGLKRGGTLQSTNSHAVQAHPKPNNDMAQTDAISHIPAASHSALLSVRSCATRQLHRTHDTFLSCLGYLLGCTQSTSLTRSKLTEAIKQVAVSGNDLLVLLERVSRHSVSSCDELDISRTSLVEQIRALLVISGLKLASMETGQAEILDSESSFPVDPVTDCVRAAGRCAADANLVLSLTEYLTSDDLNSAQSYIVGNVHAEKPVESLLGKHHMLSCMCAPSYTTLDVLPTAFTLFGPSLKGKSIDERAAEPYQNCRDNIHTSEILPGSQSTSTELYSSSHKHFSCRNSLDLSSRSSRHISTHLFEFGGLDELSDHATQTTTRKQIYPETQQRLFDPSRSALHFFHQGGSPQTNTVAQNRKHVSQREQQNKPSMNEYKASTHTEDKILLQLAARTELSDGGITISDQGEVSWGLLTALIRHLVDHDTNPSSTFILTLHLTFRSFSEPSELARALVQRYNCRCDSFLSTTIVRQRIYHFFRRWLEWYWDDRADRGALGIISDFAEFDLVAVSQLASKSLLQLVRTTPCTRPLPPTVIDAPTCKSKDTRSPRWIVFRWSWMTSSPVYSAKKLSVLGMNPLELARQLTLFQMRAFCSIWPDELIQTRWMKNSGICAPNVKALTSLSTSLSNLVADSILQASRASKRASIVEKWVEVAYHCLELRNYETLLAVIGSLNSSAIGRLQKTWTLVSWKHKQKLGGLQSVADPSRNYLTLRALLTDCIPPCLPFLGMYLRDLVYIDTSSPDTKPLPANLRQGDEEHHPRTSINFGKHIRTAKIVIAIRRFQRPYGFQEHVRIQEWLDHQISHLRSENSEKLLTSYYLKSLHLEPR